MKNKKSNTNSIVKMVGLGVFMALFVFNLVAFVEFDNGSGNLTFVSLNAFANGEESTTKYDHKDEWTTTSTTTVYDEDGKQCKTTTVTSGVDCVGTGNVDCVPEDDSSHSTSIGSC